MATKAWSWSHHWEKATKLPPPFEPPPPAPALRFSKIQSKSRVYTTNFQDFYNFFYSPSKASNTKSFIHPQRLPTQSLLFTLKSFQHKVFYSPSKASNTKSFIHPQKLPTQLLLCKTTLNLPSSPPWHPQAVFSPNWICLTSLPEGVEISIECQRPKARGREAMVQRRSHGEQHGKQTQTWEANELRRRRRCAFPSLPAK